MKYYSKDFEEYVLIIPKHRVLRKPANPDNLVVYDEKEIEICRRAKLTGCDLRIIHAIKKGIGGVFTSLEANVPWDPNEQKAAPPKLPEKDPAPLADSLFHPVLHGPFKGALSNSKSRTSPRSSSRKR